MEMDCPYLIEPEALSHPGSVNWISEPELASQGLFLALGKSSGVDEAMALYFAVIDWPIDLE